MSKIMFFKPLSLYIGLRYIRAKRRSHFISFISLVSMLGIALGVTVLITVLSVMNGFDHEIRSKIFSMARQVSISTETESLADWQKMQANLARVPHVTATAPYVSGQGMLTHMGVVSPASILGVLPQAEEKVSQIASHIETGSLTALKPGEFGIVLGSRLAERLGLMLGDKVNLIIPIADMTPIGVIPRFKRFTVMGLFHMEGDFGFDSGMAFIHLKDAQTLFDLNNAVSGLRLKLDDLYLAPNISKNLKEILPASYKVSDWTQEYGVYFQAIALEKTMMFIILLLVIAIAAFNLVSSLMMVVTDKTSEIAILRTIGTRPTMIMNIFMMQGLIIGAVGTLLGLVGGVILSLNTTAIVSFIQKLFHINLVSSSIFFLNYLPSRLYWSDVVHVCLLAFLLSLIATFYPSWKASHIQPADALRYE